MVDRAEYSHYYGKTQLVAITANNCIQANPFSKMTDF